MTPRIDTLRRQLQALQAQHAAGSIAEPAFGAARQRLERELVDAVMAQAPPTPAPRRLQGALALGVLALAALGYALTGSPRSAQIDAQQAAVNTAPAAAVQDDDAPLANDPKVAEIVERMAQRLQDRPDDARGWALLARAYAALGRNTEAVPAFQKAVALAGNDASLLADYADTLATESGGRFSAETRQLLTRALALEPAHLKALGLSGNAAFDAGDDATAVRLWQQVEVGLSADSPMLPRLRASIAQARERGGLAATALPAAVAMAAATSISGSVRLSEALVARASPQDTVFVFARAAENPGMPLAVLRKQVADLPLRFTLDDSMAMAPSARISNHAQIVVSARISKSGEAQPQPGDLGGQSAVVAPGASGIAIEIADVLAQ